jgi:hypothetical protein
MKLLFYFLSIRKTPIEKAVDSFVRFNEGQKLKRKFQSELAKFKKPTFECNPNRP